MILIIYIQIWHIMNIILEDNVDTFIVLGRITEAGSFSKWLGTTLNMDENCQVCPDGPRWAWSYVGKLCCGPGLMIGFWMFLLEKELDLMTLMDQEAPRLLMILYCSGIGFQRTLWVYAVFKTFSLAVQQLIDRSMSPFEVKVATSPRWA